MLARVTLVLREHPENTINALGSVATPYWASYPGFTFPPTSSPVCSVFLLLPVTLTATGYMPTAKRAGPSN